MECKTILMCIKVKIMIEIFVNNFIKPQYRERLLYELKSIKQIREKKHLLNY